jgi:hypothetical protein
MSSNFFIDPSQIDSIPDERLRNQAREMLKQFPHLAGEQPQAQQPQAFQQPRQASDDVLDYSNFGPQNIAAPPPPSHVRPKVPELKVDPVNHMFSQVEPEKQEETVQETPQRESGTFDPTGKEHPILVKMRAVLGMSTKKYSKSF